MSLKGRGQRAQACLIVVINIKEPLVVVEGWRGREDTGHGRLFVSDALVTSQTAL